MVGELEYWSSRWSRRVRLDGMLGGVEKLINPLRIDGPRAAGPYRLGGRLGEGGMGQVFFGRPPGGRTVAVKLIRPELAGESGFRRRFAIEVESARAVVGDHTASVVDADAYAAVPWLATEFVPGPSLAEAVDAYGPLSEPSVDRKSVV